MRDVAPSENELHKAARHQWPAALVDLLDVAAQSLKGQMPEEQAERVATTVIAAIANYHGGRQFYLPKGQGLERAMRDREIYRDYKHTRESVLQLAEQYRLTEQAVYKIIEEQRALHKKRLPT
ncbi:MAG: Mor transcription activator family protein [Pseudomonadota bacterium]